MREKAIVVLNKGSQARVEIVRSSACDHCQGCDVGRKKKTIRVWASNPLNATKGQTVEIELKAATILTATFIAYIIPLFSFFAGISLGYLASAAFGIIPTELFSLFIGLLMMGISFLGIHLYSKNAGKTQKYNSRIINIM